MNPRLVLAAIEAGVRLGRELHAALLDETAAPALVLPLAALPGEVSLSEVRAFFGAPGWAGLAQPGGPYHGLAEADLVMAYRTLKYLEERLGPVGAARPGVADLVVDLHRFEQLRKGFGVRHPLRRLLGELVITGVDFFVAHPEAQARDSNARRLVRGFVEALDPDDFVEGGRGEVVGHLFRAALVSLSGRAELAGDDRRLPVLLGGMARALLDGVNRLPAGGQAEREECLACLAGGLVRGGGRSLESDPSLLLGDSGPTRALVQSAVRQILEGIRSHEVLFSGRILEGMTDSALRILGEYPGRVQEGAAAVRLARLVQASLGAMTDGTGQGWYPRESVGRVVQQVLEWLRGRPELVLGDSSPGVEVWVPRMLGAVAQGFSRPLCGTAHWANQLSRGQRHELLGGLLPEVARHPDRLLGYVSGDGRRVALAQVIGSAVRSMGREPHRYVDGAALIRVLVSAVRVSAQNVPLLLSPLDHAQGSNQLFRVLRQVVRAIDTEGDPRRLVTPEVFSAICERVLRVCSASAEAMEGPRRDPVLRVLRRSLGMARGVLAGQIDGGNLPWLVEGVLHAVLWEELRLENMAAVEAAAHRVLRADNCRRDAEARGPVRTGS